MSKVTGLTDDEVSLADDAAWGGSNHGVIPGFIHLSKVPGLTDDEVPLADGMSSILSEGSSKSFFRTADISGLLSRARVPQNRLGSGD